VYRERNQIKLMVQMESMMSIGCSLAHHLDEPSVSCEIPLRQLGCGEVRAELCWTLDPTACQQSCKHLGTLAILLKVFQCVVANTWQLYVEWL
jgi:hypothetical protein